MEQLHSTISTLVALRLKETESPMKLNSTAYFSCRQPGDSNPEITFEVNPEVEKEAGSVDFFQSSRSSELTFQNILSNLSSGGKMTQPPNLNSNFEKPNA